jgi:hypothetical protein
MQKTPGFSQGVFCIGTPCRVRVPARPRVWQSMPKSPAEAYADTSAILPLLVGWIPGSLIVGVAFGLALLTLWLYQRPMKD